MASYLGWAMNALKSGPNGCLKPGGLHITRNKARQVFFLAFLCRKIKIKSIASLIATPQLSPWISCWPVVGPVLDAFTL